jgi:hypothetical protein
MLGISSLAEQLFASEQGLYSIVLDYYYYYYYLYL